MADRDDPGDDLAAGWADEPTGVYNIAALRLLAEHHMRLADRAKQFMILVFLTLEDLDEVRAQHGQQEADRLLAEAAEVIRGVTRESDVVARTDDASFCVLLTGDATGAETLVLSRLVEAVAVRNSEQAQAPTLSLRVGTARYDPASPTRLDDMLRGSAEGEPPAPGAGRE